VWSEGSERDVVRRTDGHLPGSISDRVSKLGESRNSRFRHIMNPALRPTFVHPAEPRTLIGPRQLIASTGVETPQCFGSRTDAQVRA